MSTAGGSGSECRGIGGRRGEAARSLTRPRTAVVLGSGGVVGAAWMTGALHAVQQRLPVPVGDVDLIVGTSAGSVLAAALRCGVTLDEMTAAQNLYRELGFTQIPRYRADEKVDTVFFELDLTRRA